MEDRSNGHTEEEVIFERKELDDNEYIYPQNTDNVKLLMTPGDENPTNLYMRGAIPSEPIALCFVLRQRRCRDHNSQEGVEDIRNMIAALVGVNARRAELVSDTLIGERRNDGVRRGLVQKMRDLSGIGGDKE